MSVKKKIGKVSLDSNFVTRNYNYADVDIVEKDILDAFKNGTDTIKVLTEDTRWPIRYHLSPERRNLLEWYRFRKNASMLEVGSGCGALTGLFCERLSHVTSIELSPMRAEITAHRHQNISNLKIIVGNLFDIDFKGKKFDYISVIGCLESADQFIRTSDPCVDFLKKIHSLLTDDGIVIVAIDNKFGLNFLGGFREDHTNRLFDSIENYPHYDRVRTFSNTEIRKLLKQAEFRWMTFYYPVPDYRLPKEVFSEDYPPTLAHNIAEMESNNYDHDTLCLFDRRRVCDNIIENGMFELFSHSFLIFGHKAEGPS
jgi:2-polyprenyl-3-methyl-5-hydroxy-6-metoxy-1,4-benzoquinol methylase